MAWQFMEEIGQRQNVYWLPIDHDQRGERLKALGERLGRTFDPDWSIRKNEGTESRGPPPPVDLSAVYAIPVVKELYTWAA